LLLTATDDDGDADRLGQRAGEALDADADFLPVGDTSNGLLWRYVEAQDEREARPAAGPLRPIVLISWGLVFGSALLLAIPTSPRRRRSRAGTPEAEQPATTFDEERDE